MLTGQTMRASGNRDLEVEVKSQTAEGKIDSSTSPVVNWAVKEQRKKRNLELPAPIGTNTVDIYARSRAQTGEAPRRRFLRAGQPS